MTRLFVSYNSSDRAAVEPLVNLLELAEVIPVFDRWSFVPGDLWIERIEGELLSCGATLICLGPRGRGGVQRHEIQLALELAWRNAERRVIVVLLPDAADLDQGFLSLATYVDLRAGIDARGVKRLLAAVAGEEPGPPQFVRAQCPYPGLAPFTHLDSAMFFGRESETEALLAEVERLFESDVSRRMLTLVGASGSGKSSLVRAGLASSVAAGALGRGSGWQIAILRPGPRPLASLARGLLRAVGARAPGRVKDLHQRLLEEPTSLAEFHALNCREEGGRLLIIVDQLEELLTHNESVGVADAFLDALLGAAESRDICVVSTLRADFLGHFLERSPSFAVALQASQRLVLPLSEDGLRAAINRPAALRRRRLEPALVEVLAEEVERSPRQLPLLQVMLTQLWEATAERTISSSCYHQLGRLSGAITRHADAVLELVDDRHLARRLLCSLVHPGDNIPDSRLRRSREELDCLGSATGDLVDLLVRKRLLAVADGKVELIHDALIREWPTLQRWLDSDRATLAALRELEHGAQRWREAGNVEDHLWRGSRLDEGLRLEADADAVVSDVVGAFLKASVDARDEQRAAEVAAEQTLREARLDAERRLEQAKKVAETIHSTITFGLTRSTDAPRVRDELLQASAELLESLGGADVPSLVGPVMSGLNERGDAALSHGDFEAAHGLYRQAYELARQGVKERPGPETRYELVVSLSKLGSVAESRGRMDEALAHYRQMLAIERSLVEQDPTDDEGVASLADTMRRLSLAASAAGHDEEAYLLAMEALEIERRRTAESPDDASVLGELSMSLGNVANLALGRGAVDEAKRWSEECLELDRRTFERSRDSVESMSFLSSSLQVACNIERYLGHTERALELVREAVALDRRWCEADPDNRDALLLRCTSTLELAELEEMTGRYDEAWATVHEALDAIGVLCDRNPDDVQATQHRFTALHQISDLCVIRGDSERAEERELEALGVARDLVASAPTEVQSHTALGMALDRLGDFRGEASDHRRSLEYYEASLRSVRDCERLFPEDEGLTRNRTVCELKLGEALAAVGRFEESLVLLRSALETREVLADQESESTEAIRDVSIAHSSLSSIHEKRDDLESALEHARYAVELDRALVERSPADLRFQRDLAISLTRLGDAWGMGRKAEARTPFVEALEIRRALLRNDPTDKRALGDLTVSLHRVGDTEEHAVALRWYQEALEVDLSWPDWRSSPRQSRFVSISLEKVGAAQLGLGAFELARTTMEECCRLRRILVEQSPESMQLLRDFGEGLLYLGLAQVGLGRSDEAREILTESREATQRWLSVSPADKDAMKWLDEIDRHLGKG